MRKLIALAFFANFSGCAWYQEMVTRPPEPDTRIHLAFGQIMDFNLSTRRNRAGQHIDEFTCEPLLMQCTSWGIELTCRCELRP